jgi:hypothetical protein
MKNKIRQSWIILGGAAVYYYLFWQSPSGLNSLIFSLFLLAVLGLTQAEKLQSRGALLAICATIISAGLVAWHNSALTKIGHSFSFLILIGFLQKMELRFIWYAFLLAMVGFMEGPKRIYEEFMSSNLNHGRYKEIFRWLKLTLVPLALGFVFFVIYYAANAQFAALIDRFTAALSFNVSFDWLIARGIFFFIGILIFSALILKSSYAHLFKQLSFKLIRRRSKNPLNLKISNSSIALKNEYRVGLITIGLLNGLLFIVNMTDLRYVWVEYEDTTPQMLSQYVHEGTYLLIIAILLAMVVLLYFFRKNLNFYPENDHLKHLANLWIIQNGVLALSVAMRNYHYIHEFGLAYKRLGVIWFLVLTIVGLLSFHQKIAGRKNINYLLHINGWALYASIMLFSLINWDLVITKYNLSMENKGNLDIQFLTEDVSDKNLYLLLEHKYELGLNSTPPAPLNELLEQKQTAFENKVKNRSWKSWNWSDQRNLNYLRKKRLLGWQKDINN